MKKRIIAGATIALLALSGCASGGASTGDEDVTLRITWWGNTDRAEATQAALDLFEEKHPSIKVQALPSTFDGYYNKLTTQFAANAGPDIFQDDQVRTFADKGVLLDLTDTAIDFDKIDDDALKQGTVDGKIYEVPAGTSPMAFVFKPGVLETAGVEAPTAETSWEDLVRLAEQLQPKLPEGTYAIADSTSQPNHFEVFLRQRGKGWFNDKGTELAFDESDLEAWWGYWQDVRDKGLTTPVDQSVAGSGGDVSQNPVAKDLVAMGIYGTAISLPSADWQYGAMPGEGNNPGVYSMRSSSWAVNANTAHPEEAVQLLDFLVNDEEAAAILGVSRGVPASDAARTAAREVADEKETFIHEYADYLLAGNSGTAPSPDPSGMRTLRSDIFTRYSQKVFFGEMTIADAAASTMKEAKDLLESRQ